MLKIKVDWWAVGHNLKLASCKFAGTIGVIGVILAFVSLINPDPSLAPVGMLSAFVAVGCAWYSITTTRQLAQEARQRKFILDKPE